MAFLVPRLSWEIIDILSGNSNRIAPTFDRLDPFVPQPTDSKFANLQASMATQESKQRKDARIQKRPFSFGFASNG
jgi:hypothetical protein